MYQIYTELYDVDELLALARMDLQEKNCQESLWKIKLAMGKCDDGHEAYALAGRVYAQIGLYDKARDAYVNYITHNPDAILERFQHGMVLFDMGDFEKAQATWQELLQQSPGYPPALYYMAICWLQADNKDKAMQLITELKNTAPKDNYYVNLAIEMEQRMNQNEDSDSSAGAILDHGAVDTRLQ